MNFAPRGKGWKQDDPNVIDSELVGRHVSHLLTAEPLFGEMPDSVDYTGHLGGEIPNQMNTSSCVGQAFATALHVAARVAGIPIPRPSAKAIYDFARGEDRPYIELQDEGSRPLAAIRCIQEKGLVADSVWPLLFHPGGISNVNVRPPLDVYTHALEATLGSYYRIASGRNASELVRLALARGYCPVFAMPVDEVFERWSGSAVYEGRVQPILGWHMQAITGYGPGYLNVPGSWGKAFADDGVVKIATNYFDSGECRDIIVPTAVPNVRTPTI